MRGSTRQPLAAPRHGVRAPVGRAQVRQLCVGIPSELKAPDGSELDEFMHCKEHPLARMLHDLSSTENARPLSACSACLSRQRSTLCHAIPWCR